MLLKNEKEEVDVCKLYGQDCTMSKEDFIKKYKVKDNGLSSNEASYRRKKFGTNEIKQAKPKKWYHYFFESLFTPFNCILLGIIFILIYTDIYLAETPSYANIIVIINDTISALFISFFNFFISILYCFYINL